MYCDYLYAGKEACILCVGDVLVVLSDLLEHEDQEVNVTLDRYGDDDVLV